MKYTVFVIGIVYLPRSTVCIKSIIDIQSSYFIIGFSDKFHITANHSEYAATVSNSIFHIITIDIYIPDCSIISVQYSITSDTKRLIITSILFCFLIYQDISLCAITYQCSLIYRLIYTIIYSDSILCTLSIIKPSEETLKSCSRIYYCNFLTFSFHGILKDIFKW